MRKRVWALMGLGWAIAGLPVWGQQPRRVVAFAQDTLKNDFRRAQVAEVQQALAAQQLVQFVASDAQGQTSLLIRQIEQFARQPVDVLIIGTSDESAVVPVVRQAYQAGIPVIVLDRGIKGDAYSTFIHSDNVHIGQLGAEYIARQLGGKGRVLLLEGLQTADVTQLRSRGFNAVMRRHPGIEVTRRTGNYLRKDALLEVRKLLADGTRVDAIFAESDSMLSGARMALAEAQVDVRRMVTVGCDYTSEARDAIREGTQSASILFPLGGLKAAEVALKLLARQTVPRDILIPVRLVTKDLIDQVPPVF